MNYEKKYKNALEWARQVMSGETGFIRKEVEEVFPELKESEDEKIRKEIIRFVRMEVDDEIVGNKWLTWLEKQSKQKPQGKTSLEAIKEEKVDNQNCVNPTDKKP